MYTESQNLSQICEQREIMLSQIRQKRRENMLKQKRNFENIYPLNILEMANELNEDEAFCNFTHYIRLNEETIENCSALIKFDDNHYHYFTTLDDGNVIRKEVTNNFRITTKRMTLTEYLQDISMKPIEYMLIHYIGKYIKFTNFDSFVSHLNLFYERTIKAKEIYKEISSSSSNGEYDKCDAIEGLLNFIDNDPILHSEGYNEFFKNLTIVNYNGGHPINFNICNLNENYKINILNNILLLRFSNDIELTEFISKMADMINDEKNCTILTFADKEFRIHNT